MPEAFGAEILAEGTQPVDQPVTLSAVRTAFAPRARRGRRSGWRRRANPGRAAPAARSWRLSRAVSAPPRPVFAPAAGARRRDRRRARPPWRSRTERGSSRRRLPRSRPRAGPRMRTAARRAGAARTASSVFGRERNRRARPRGVRSPPPRPGPAGGRHQRATRQLMGARGREGRQTRTGDAGLGGSNRLRQSVEGADVQGAGGDRDRGSPLPGRSGRQRAPGQLMGARGREGRPAE